MVTTERTATVKALLAYAREKSVAELMVPRALEVIDKMPLLGTGKIDIPALQKMRADLPELEPVS